MSQSFDATVDRDEIAHFEAMAEKWWDPNGPFRPLHRQNPVRLTFFRQHLIRHFVLDPTLLRPLTGLSILDVGCGGGLIAEPLARLGANVTAIDASARNIACATAHAHVGALTIDYQAITAEELLAKRKAQKGFDLVLALEIVEHVADLPRFINSLSQLVRPGGVIGLSTLNRTCKSFALAIIGAEYLLRWLPRGTHRWSKFVRPSELAALLRSSGIQITEVTGLRYNPILDEWACSRDVSVNYLALATRPTAK